MPELAWFEILIWLLAASLLLAGVAGLILPAIPGPPLLFGAAWLAAYAGDFERVGLLSLLLLGVLAMIGVLADFIAGALGARRYGASPRSVGGATLGAIIGLFFGLPGLILGPFIGAAVLEFSVDRSVRGAGRAGVGATIGVVLGTAAKIAVGVAMLATFGFVYWR